MKTSHLALLVLACLLSVLLLITPTVAQTAPITTPTTTPPPVEIPDEGQLNPDDFHRIDIDVEQAVEYHSHFPQPIPPGTKHSRNAYVMIHYEGTPRDDLYVLGTRVAIRSIHESGSLQDVVIICADNVRQSTIDVFTRDGAVVKMVPNIPNPYKGEQQRRRTYKSRFEFTFNKLYIWNLLEYERVIYLDADNLVVRNLDELFLCGHFCPTFFNPLFFHTGMMVVKPDAAKFVSLIHDLLSLDVFSYDGADQGFLTAAFPSLEGAPLLNPVRELLLNGGKPSEEPHMRFPMEYNINSAFFYHKMSWDHFRVANLPISYNAHHQAQLLSQTQLSDTSLLLSPYEGVYPNIDIAAALAKNGLEKEYTPESIIMQLAKGLNQVPQDQLDLTFPVGSLDFCIGPLLKPWNWLPYIYFHTVRYWAPIRMRVEADDWAQGYIPTSAGYFYDSLANGVFPLLCAPLLMYIVSKLLPVMEQIRKVARTAVRLVGSTTPAVIFSLSALIWSFSHLAQNVPLETRPELAWVSVFSIIILAQYNVAFFLALILSPPCPSTIPSRADPATSAVARRAVRSRGGDLHVAESGPGVDINLKLDKLDIQPSCIYGITSLQYTEFFKHWFGNFLFFTQGSVSNGENLDNLLPGDDLVDDVDDMERNTNSPTLIDLTSDLNDLDQQLVLDACDFTHNLSFSDPYSSVELLNKFITHTFQYSQQIENKQSKLTSTKKSQHQQKGQKSQHDPSALDTIDEEVAPHAPTHHGDDQFDIELHNDGLLTDLETDLDGLEGSSLLHDNNNNQIAPQSSSTPTSPQNSSPMQQKQVQQKQVVQQQLKQPQDVALLQPKETTFHDPNLKLQKVHRALRQVVLRVLETSLSLRGGIYPTLMWVHMAILAFMGLWLAKIGWFEDFIFKIAHLASLAIVFILYSVYFTKRVINTALGDPYILGSMKLLK